MVATVLHNTSTSDLMRIHTVCKSLRYQWSKQTQRSCMNDKTDKIFPILDDIPPFICTSNLIFFLFEIFSIHVDYVVVVKVNKLLINKIHVIIVLIKFSVYIFAFHINESVIYHYLKMFNVLLSPHMLVIETTMKTSNT